MKRVAYIVYMGSGLESFVYREIEELYKRGVNISLYATRFRHSETYSPKANWRVHKISVLWSLGSFFYWFVRRTLKVIHLSKLGFRHGVVMELFVAFDYARRMNNENIDHIHAHFGDRKYFIGYFCKHLISKPLSVTIHAHEIYVNPNDKFFRYAIHDADKVVSISDLNRDILINQYGVNQNKIEVIRLSVDLDLFKKEQECVRVLTVARFTERKGFYELLQVIRDYRFEKVHFYIVGFGPLDLEQLVKDYSISEFVTVFNKMNSQQLAFFYKTCDIFCLPSKSTKEEGSEGIPVVLMEAMASEMIIVATTNGSTCELVDNILVDEGSVHSLAEGLKKAIGIARDEHLSDRIGVANRERVLDLHGEANVDNLKQYLYD